MSASQAMKNLGGLTAPLRSYQTQMFVDIAKLELEWESQVSRGNGSDGGAAATLMRVRDLMLHQRTLTMLCVDALTKIINNPLGLRE
jgi:hypothetical protein